MVQDALFLAMGCQWILSLLGSVHCCRFHLVGRYPKRWGDRWSLGLGDGSIHSRLGYSTGKGSPHYQYMDEVSRHCHPWKSSYLVHIHSGLRNRCTNAEHFDGIPRSHSKIVYESSLLGAGPRSTRVMSDQGLCMEIVSQPI